MLWWTYMTIASKCSLDLTDYPFDTQKCLLFFGPHTYYSREMDFAVTGEPFSPVQLFKVKRWII